MDKEYLSTEEYFGKLLKDINDNLLALLVVNMRIYDILAVANGEAEPVLDIHQKGYVVGPPPELKGFYEE